ncbi:hypothetical protein BA187_11960 [Serratia marcescens]|nr:hypothetical protein BA187_11960 [Serratia marcescens]
MLFHAVVAQQRLVKRILIAHCPTEKPTGAYPHALLVLPNVCHLMNEKMLSFRILACIISFIECPAKIQLPIRLIAVY